MLTTSRAAGGRPLDGLCRARKGVGGLGWGDRLRDVPTPRETVPGPKDLQSGCLGRRLSVGGNAHCEPGKSHSLSYGSSE